MGRARENQARASGAAFIVDVSQPLWRALASQQAFDPADPLGIGGGVAQRIEPGRRDPHRDQRQKFAVAEGGELAPVKGARFDDTESPTRLAI